MGALIVLIVPGVLVNLANLVISRGEWAFRNPCAAATLWLGAVLGVPLGLVSAGLIVFADEHAASLSTPRLITILLTAAVVVYFCLNAMVRFLAINARARRSCRRQTTLVDLFGQPWHGPGRVVILPESRPMVYSLPCVFAGRTVVSTGALNVLTDESLRAVLAHERGHLLKRHHLLLQLSTAVARALPWSRSAQEVAVRMKQFIESSADCYARSRHDPQALLRAISALAQSPKPQAPMLSASGGTKFGHRVELLAGRRRCCTTARSTILIGISVVAFTFPVFTASMNDIIDLCVLLGQDS